MKPRAVDWALVPSILSHRAHRWNCHGSFGRHSRTRYHKRARTCLAATDGVSGRSL